MGFFDIFRRKQQRSFDQLSEFGLGLPTATGQTVTVDGSLALPAVFVCVRVLAESIGSMPLHLYRRASNGDRMQATDHPLHKLFRFAPNSYQTSLEAREFLTACVAMRGNGYAFIERHDGVVAGVWPLHPARVQVIVDGTVIDLVYKTQREKFEAIAHDVKELHTKGQPVLVGTVSIEKSELLSELLKKFGVPHDVLNAKNHEKEAEIDLVARLQTRNRRKEALDSILK